MHERYFPLDVLGARPALAMTPESEVQLAGLDAAQIVALAAYEALGGVRPKQL